MLKIFGFSDKPSSWYVAALIFLILSWLCVVGGASAQVARGGSSAGNATITATSTCRTATTIPSSASDAATNTAPMCSAKGKLVVEQFAPSELQLTAYQETTGSTMTNPIAAQGAGVLIKLVGLQCFNSGSSNVTLTLNDSATTKFFLPAGSGNNPSPFVVPLSIAANTALTVTLSAGPTSGTVGCAFQAYKA